MSEKTVWIIGANSDIACAFLKKYGGEFENIVLAGRDEAKLNTVAENNKNASAYRLDLNDCQSIQLFLGTAPTPNAVFNFAGYVPKSENNSYSAKEIEQAFSSNAVGLITLVEGVLDRMKEKRDGVILNLGSCSAVRGRASNRIYSAGKSATENYFQGLAQECFGFGIRVIDIRLGRVDTKMLASFNPESHAFVISAEKAADLVYKAFKKNRTKVYYQKCWRFLSFFYSLIPVSVYNRKKF